MAPINTAKSKQIHSIDHGSIANFKTAHSTPMSIPPAIHRGVETPRMAPPKGPASSGTNAQSEAMGRTLEKTRKVQKVYGVPGAK
jgi:hypothetical protein